MAFLAGAATPIRTLTSLPLSSSSSRSNLSRVKVSSSSTTSSPPPPPTSSNPLLLPLRSSASAAVLLAASSLSLLSPARADPPPPPTAAAAAAAVEEQPIDSGAAAAAAEEESISDSADAIRSLVYAKLDAGDDEGALAILSRATAARPEELEWKLLAARVHAESGDPAAARTLLEDALVADPFAFEALFELAMLLERSGDGAAALARLQEALDAARASGGEVGAEAARDVRLIMAQVQFLEKKIDEALASYEDLAREDPSDYRPVFCQGVIYSLLDKNKEAKEKFARCREIAPGKFDVDAYFQTPLSRMRLFGTDESNS